MPPRTRADEDQDQGRPLWSRERTPGGDAAGVILALFTYPLVVNVLRGGPGQMWGWVKAKWLNKPMGSGSVVPIQQKPAAAPIVYSRSPTLPPGTVKRQGTQ